MKTPTTRPLDPIHRPAQRTERRLRLQRALDFACKTLFFAIALAVVSLVLRKTGLLAERPTRLLLMGAFAAVVFSTVVVYLRRLPELAGARALDRHHALSDRLANALAFASLPERTPFMEAAIDDALAHASKLQPRRAAPFRFPSEGLPVLLLSLLLVSVSLFEVRRREVIITSPVAIDAVDVSPDDLDALREYLRTLETKDTSDETKAVVEEFNRLIEDLAAKRLDRTEAFRRMQALEDKLLQGREADKKALEEALAKMGEELKKSDLSKPAGEALESKNLAKADQALRDLAKKLREGKVDKAKLNELRDALKKASAAQANRSSALRQKRDALAQQLLKQRQRGADAGADADRSVLQKKERELERLDRELEQHERAERQLERLDRELSQAAEDLLRDLGMSAKDLEEGAEDINRMARQEMTQEDKEQLRQRLQELRETLRRQGQGGQGQMSRMRRFQGRARGQQGQGQGQGQGEGQQGQGQGQGQGDQPGKNGETWVLGPNGEKIMVISRGSQGSGHGQGGKEAGKGHDPNLRGAATRPNMGTQDTQVAGQDTGQGASRSEVILGAAERGFSHRGYRKVYTEYRTVAEEALNKDEIPGGYRFYVRRYFQLIRPRDEAK